MFLDATGTVVVESVSWLRVHEHDVPTTPRLLGKPGVGKTTTCFKDGNVF